MARTPTKVQIYWDVQDRDNERWAYRASDEQGLIDSGSLESDPDDLDGAITEAICALGLDLIADLFVTSKDDGGYAVWEGLPVDDDEVCIDCGGDNIEEGTCVDCEAKDCLELDSPKQGGYEVVTTAHNTGLDSSVFATRDEAERALRIASDIVQGDYQIVPTKKPVNITFDQWDALGW